MFDPNESVCFVMVVITCEIIASDNYVNGVRRIIIYYTNCSFQAQFFVERCQNVRAGTHVYGENDFLDNVYNNNVTGTFLKPKFALKSRFQTFYYLRKSSAMF